MTVRTTSAAVGLIIEVDDTIDLTPFIEVANALVTEFCATATRTVNGVTSLYYDDTRLELIERWLSAHFYAVRDPRAHWEAAGPVSERLESLVGMFLKSSKYGQHAMFLDTAGGLAEWDRTMEKGPIKRKVSATWLGIDTCKDKDVL
jgi:hypothetical protein